MFLKKIIIQKIKNIAYEVYRENTVSKAKRINIEHKIPETVEILDSQLNGNIKIGENAYIYKTLMDGNITIGNNTSINGPNTDIYAKINQVKIGSFCSIARNVNIQEYNHFASHATSYFIKNHIFGEDWTKEIESRGNIEIGNDVWIGAQCVILSGVTIGDGAIIAANTVVNKEIPPYAIVAGSPAKVIKYRFSKDIIEKFEAIKWWDWSLEKIKKNYEFFDGEFKIEKFDKIK